MRRADPSREAPTIHRRQHLRPPIAYSEHTPHPVGEASLRTTELLLENLGVPTVSPVSASVLQRVKRGFGRPLRGFGIEVPVVVDFSCVRPEEGIHDIGNRLRRPPRLQQVVERRGDSHRQALVSRLILLHRTTWLGHEASDKPLER